MHRPAIERVVHIGASHALGGPAGVLDIGWYRSADPPAVGRGA
jgi:hypothetical protein